MWLLCRINADIFQFFRDMIAIIQLHPVIIWDCIKTRYLFKLPKITLSFFYSYRFLRWWAPFRQEVQFFQLSVGVKASVVESQQTSFFVSISLHCLLFCINFPLMFLSCCICVLSFCISFHFAFKSFHVPSLDRSGVYLPKHSRFFFICRYRFLSRLAIVLEACFRVAIFRLHENIVFWAGNALAVLKCRPS